jgi:ribosomal protein S18 acetylase RimI-like enzyme
VDAGSFLPPTAPAAALLDDQGLLAELAAACGPSAWEHGGIHAGGGPIYGAVEGERLLAACMIARWPGRIAHLCVATDPQARGRGLGQAVVGAAAAAALADGQLTQYRTLAANAPAMGLAARLGFTAYATTVAVRLAAAEEA